MNAPHKRATIPIATAGAPPQNPVFDVFTTKKDEIVGWARVRGVHAVDSGQA